MVEVRVEFKYKAEQEDELTITEGDIIKNVIMSEGGWWEGELNGKKGLFPDNFVKVINDEPKKEVKKEEKKDIQASKRQSVRDLANKIKDRVPDIPVAPRKKDAGHKKKKAKVVFSYEPENDDELKLDVDDIVEILKQEEEGWWEGSVHGQTGMFPSNFVEIIEDDDVAEKPTSTTTPTSADAKDPDFNPIKGKKIVGVGLGNIFDSGPIKLRSTGGGQSKKGATTEKEKKADTEEPVVMRRQKKDGTFLACSPVPAPCTNSSSGASHQLAQCRPRTQNTGLENDIEHVDVYDADSENPCSRYITKSFTADDANVYLCDSRSGLMDDESLVEYDDVDAEPFYFVSEDEIGHSMLADAETGESEGGAIAVGSCSFPGGYTCINDNAQTTARDESLTSGTSPVPVSVMSVLEDLDRCLSQSLNDSPSLSNCTSPSVDPCFKVPLATTDEFADVSNVVDFNKAIDSVAVTKKRLSHCGDMDRTPPAAYHVPESKAREAASRNLTKLLESGTSSPENEGNRSVGFASDKKGITKRQERVFVEEYFEDEIESSDTYLSSLRRSGNLSPFMKVIADKYSLFNSKKPVVEQTISAQSLEPEESYATRMLAHCTPCKLSEPVAREEAQMQESRECYQDDRVEHSASGFVKDILDDLPAIVRVASEDDASTTVQLDDSSARLCDLSVTSSQDQLHSDTGSLDSGTSEGILAQMIGKEKDQSPLSNCSQRTDPDARTPLKTQEKNTSEFYTKKIKPSFCTVNVSVSDNSCSWFSRDQVQSPPAKPPGMKFTSDQDPGKPVAKQVQDTSIDGDQDSILVKCSADAVEEETRRTPIKHSSFCFIPFSQNECGSWYGKCAGDYEKSELQNEGKSILSSKSETLEHLNRIPDVEEDDSDHWLSGDGREQPRFLKKWTRCSVPSLTALAERARQDYFCRRLARLVGNCSLNALKHEEDLQGKGQQKDTAVKVSHNSASMASEEGAVNTLCAAAVDNGAVKKRDVEASPGSINLQSSETEAEFYMGRSIVRREFPEDTKTGRPEESSSEEITSRSFELKAWKLDCPFSSHQVKKHGSEISNSTLKSGELLKPDMNNELIRDCCEKRKKRSFWKKSVGRKYESPVKLMGYRSMDNSCSPPNEAELHASENDESLMSGVGFEELEGTRLLNFLPGSHPCVIDSSEEAESRNRKGAFTNNRQRYSINSVKAGSKSHKDFAGTMQSMLCCFFPGQLPDEESELLDRPVHMDRLEEIEVAETEVAGDGRGLEKKQNVPDEDSEYSYEPVHLIRLEEVIDIAVDGDVRGLEKKQNVPDEESEYLDEPVHLIRLEEVIDIEEAEYMKGVERKPSFPDIDPDCYTPVHIIRWEDEIEVCQAEEAGNMEALRERENVPEEESAYSGEAALNSRDVDEAELCCSVVDGNLQAVVAVEIAPDEETQLSDISVSVSGEGQVDEVESCQTVIHVGENMQGLEEKHNVCGEGSARSVEPMPASSEVLEDEEASCKPLVDENMQGLERKSGADEDTISSVSKESEQISRDNLYSCDDSPDADALLNDLEEIDFTATPQYATGADVDEGIGVFIQATMQSFDDILVESFQSDSSTDAAIVPGPGMGVYGAEGATSSVVLNQSNVSSESPIPHHLEESFGYPSPIPKINTDFPGEGAVGAEGGDGLTEVRNFTIDSTDESLLGRYPCYRTEEGPFKPSFDTSSEIQPDVNWSTYSNVDSEDGYRDSPYMSSPDLSRGSFNQNQNSLIERYRSERAFDYKSVPLQMSGDDDLSCSLNVPPTEGADYMDTRVSKSEHCCGSGYISSARELGDMELNGDAL